MNKEHGAATKNKNACSQGEDDKQCRGSSAALECQYSYFLKLDLEDMNHFRAYILPPEQDGKPWLFSLRLSNSVAPVTVILFE